MYLPGGACALDHAAAGGLTQEEVAAAMGLARTTVSKIETAALRKLAQAQGVEVETIALTLSSWSSLSGNIVEERTAETVEAVEEAWGRWLAGAEELGGGAGAELVEAVEAAGVADAEHFAARMLERAARAGVIARGRAGTWIVTSDISCHHG